MIPLLRTPKGTTMAFMADLLPSTGHIPLAYVMGYDTRPLLTLEEKKLFLDTAASEEWVLFWSTMLSMRHAPFRPQKKASG